MQLNYTYNLLIDIGNTNTKWILVSSINNNLHDILKLKQNYFSNSSLEFTKINQSIKNKNINKVIITNVSSKQYLNLLLNSLDIDKNKIIIFTPEKSFHNLINNYDTPKNLGCDRWVGMIAAEELYPCQTNIVISCGSATTIDFAIDSQFVGGYIINGLHHMKDILISSTAKIKLEKYEIHSLALGLNTSACVCNGALLAQTATIEKAIFSFIKDRHIVKYNCILHGKAAITIGSILQIEYQKIDNLLFLGLAKVLNG